jgi:hypothetical protein
VFWRRVRDEPADEPGIEEVVARAVELLGWEAHLAPESETLVVRGHADVARVGLTPALRSIPDGADLEQAARSVADHVRALVGAAQEGPPVDLADWSAIVPLVRTVVTGAEGWGHPGTPLHRPVADVLVEHLVVDLPERILYLKEFPDGWPVTLDEAFSAGRRAVAAHEPVEPYVLDWLAGSGVLAFSGGPYYTASRALMLPSLLDLPPGGALVAVPGRHVVLVMPLTGRPALRAIADLWSIAARLHAVAEQPVSDAVFHGDGEHLSLVASPSPPGSETGITLTPHAMRLA